MILCLVWIRLFLALKNGLSELALCAYTLKLTKSQPRGHIEPKGVRDRWIRSVMPLYRNNFCWALCLVRRTFSNLVNHKLKRNDLRKRFGLLILKGFPFQYYSQKNCGTSLTLLPSMGITTQWWALKIKLICSQSLLIVLLKGPWLHSQDLVDVVNQLHEILKKP